MLEDDVQRLHVDGLSGYPAGGPPHLFRLWTFRTLQMSQKCAGGVLLLRAPPCLTVGVKPVRFVLLTGKQNSSRLAEALCS